MTDMWLSLSQTPYDRDEFVALSTLYQLRTRRWLYLRQFRG